MFKNLLILTTNPEWQPELAEMEQALATMPYVPCGPTQADSSGWVPPRGEANGALVESVNGQRIMCMCIETKAVPGAALKRKLDEKLKAIEEAEGRKPGRKEAREIRDELVQELLPHAFPRISRVLVWHSPSAGRIYLDVGSASKGDAVTSALVKIFPGLSISNLNTQVSPQAAMTQWLTGTLEDWPASFAPGREVELQSSDEVKSVVKFGRHHLDDEQMRLHISQGKLPVKLALDFDGRVSLVLTESMILKKIKFLDGVFDTDSEQQDAGGFDADVAIATGELDGAVDGLIAGLGGVLV